MSVVKINAIEVPDGGGPELERRFGARLGAVEGTPGFLGFELLRPVAGEGRYFVYTRWETDEAFQAWSAGSGQAAHAGERSRPVATGSSLLEFEVVQSVPAAGGGPAGDGPTGGEGATGEPAGDTPGQRHAADPETNGSADTAGASVGTV